MSFAGKRTLKNIGGKVDGEIEHYRAILVRLRDDFLARATVTTEVTVLRIEDDVSNPAPKKIRVTRLNEVTIQLRMMSNQALEAGA
jgi:hypothetical protein